MNENEKIRLVLTCRACPEQYDAFLGDEQVGYLRLRHGSFRVECPDFNGKTVLLDYPDGQGCFKEYERDMYLRAAVQEIKMWVTIRDIMSAEIDYYTVDMGEYDTFLEGY